MGCNHSPLESGSSGIETFGLLEKIDP